MKARPDDFVLLVTHEFNENSAPYLTQTHAEFWQEDLNLSLDGEGGRIELPEAEVTIVFDPPIPELVEFAGGALEPFGASDIALLGRHTGIWRVLASSRVAAWPLVRIASTLIESGASSVFLPGTRQLHSPRAVRRLAMEPSPDAIANFFVAAFDGEGWMRTRGLTPFGLPELETKIIDGHNAAYFRLMDVAAAMIANGRAFEDHSSLSIGPHLHTVVAGPTGPLRDDPVNGLHGVQTLR